MRRDLYLRAGFLSVGVVDGGAVSTAALTPDERWMALALQAAERANGRSNPNPAVGAVVVRDGQVVASGATERYGDRHAERVAIASLGRDLLEDATLYVTLEPCAHVGRQPPCADLVASCRFGRCVIGMVDPNHLVDGRGLERVKAAGTEVTTRVLSAEVAAWHLPFLHRQRARTPYRACLCLTDPIPASPALDACLARLLRRADVYVTPASLLRRSVEAELHGGERSSSWVRVVVDDGPLRGDEVELLAARAALGERLFVAARADVAASLGRALSHHADRLAIVDWTPDPWRELTAVLERVAERFGMDPVASSVLAAFPGPPARARPDAVMVHVVDHDGEALSLPGFEPLSRLDAGGLSVREYVDAGATAWFTDT